MKTPVAGSVADRHVRLCLGFAFVLGILAYLPFLNLPYLPDDYLQMELGQRLGRPANWGELLNDPLYRSRSTSLFVTYLTTTFAGSSPMVLHFSSLALHVLNSFLVFSLGRSPLIGRQVAALGALVFAVRERHHEAVVWYAALPELLVFAFALISVNLWVRWLRGRWPVSDWRWGAALASFAAALFSKESAVAVVPLLAAFAWPYYGRADWRGWVGALSPFLLGALMYLGLVFSSSSGNHHFSDGTFAITPLFFVTFLNSAGRGLVVFAGLAAIVLGLLWDQRARWLAWISSLWIAAALIPYCFVTYMPRIPSRHHYLASVGYSLLVSGALLAARRKWKIGKVIPALVFAMAAIDISYLWLAKRPQFAARAAPMTELIRQMRASRERPFRVSCFPVSLDEARRAVVFTLGEPASALMASPDRGVSFCPEAAR